jgi:peptidoglycan hydrolase-like protein with peptidoglycan-binding domain
MLKGFRALNRYPICCRPSLGSSRHASSWPSMTIALFSTSCHRIGVIALLSCLVVGVLPLFIWGQEANGQETNEAEEIEPAEVESGQSGGSDGRPTLKLGSQGEAVVELQALLKLLGYYAGAVDGTYQESTATAVSAFQQAAGLQPDGIVGTETWNQLLPAAPVVSPSTATALTPTPAPTPAPTSSFPAPAPAPAPANPAPPAPIAAPAPSSPLPSPSPSEASRAAAPTPAAPAPTPTPTPAPTAALPADQPVLRIGMEGAAVTQLQERLKAIGLFNGAVDGVFGAETEIAVQEVQRRYNLEPDGVVGPATWGVLLNN